MNSFMYYTSAAASAYYFHNGAKKAFMKSHQVILPNGCNFLVKFLMSFYENCPINSVGMSSDQS